MIEFLYLMNIYIPVWFLKCIFDMLLAIIVNDSWLLDKLSRLVEDAKNDFISLYIDMEIPIT